MISHGDNHLKDHLGRNASISANGVPMGVPDGDPYTAAGAGLACVYGKVFDSWTQLARFVPNDPVSGDGFGAASIEDQHDLLTHRRAARSARRCLSDLVQSAVH